MFFKRTDTLPLNLTSYDFIKCATVIFMLIDHLGAFFLPEYTWLRVVGRLGFPAWFFLAGYSKGKEVGQTLWAGAILLVAGNMVLGQYILPMNALVSYICIRVFLTPMLPRFFANWEMLLYAAVAMVFLAMPTNYVFEYGTMAFSFAMFGYAVRNKDVLNINAVTRVLFSAFVALSVSVLQGFFFSFTMPQLIVCVAEICLVSLVLFHFRPMEFPKVTAALPNAVNAVIRFGGRYTLEIYVFHLLAIKVYLFCANYGFYKWFAPTVFPHFIER